MLPSIWKSSTLATSFPERYVRALSPTRSDQDKSYDRTSFFTRVLYGFLGLGVVVYSVVWGNLNAKCAEEETCCKGEKELNGKTPEQNTANCEINKPNLARAVDAHTQMLIEILEFL